MTNAALLLIFGVAFAAFIRGSDSAQPARNCGIPVVLPAVPTDNIKAAGRWYEYIVRTPGIDDFNGINTYTVVGDNSDPNRHTLVDTVGRFFSIKPDGTAGPCMGIYHVGNFTSDGKRHGHTWFPGTSTSAPSLYQLIYMEHDTLEVRYMCPPEAGTGQFCDNPFLFTTIRKRPTHLTPAEAHHILTATNRALEPFCLGIANMTYTKWDDSLPVCNPTPPRTYTVHRDRTVAGHRA